MPGTNYGSARRLLMIALSASTSRSAAIVKTLVGAGGFTELLWLSSRNCVASLGSERNAVSKERHVTIDHGSASPSSNQSSNGVQVRRANAHVEMTMSRFKT